MNQETQSFSSPQVVKPIQVNLDEFQISEDTFKPMTRGLGFHQDNRKPAFKPTPKERRSFAQPQTPIAQTLTSGLAPKHVSTNHLPSGLEAFYGATPAPSIESHRTIELPEAKLAVANNLKEAGQLTQFFAWIIDIAVIASFVALTGFLLVISSGIEFKMYSRILTTNDMFLFSSAIFAIYYVLYFTILDLSASPGKTILAIRLVTIEEKEVRVKNTFTRALISLLSGVALFLPMLLDFQGRLSDTKLVK